MSIFFGGGGSSNLGPKCPLYRALLHDCAIHWIYGFSLFRYVIINNAGYWSLAWKTIWSHPFCKCQLPSKLAQPVRLVWRLRGWLGWHSNKVQQHSVYKQESKVYNVNISWIKNPRRTIIYHLIIQVYSSDKWEKLKVSVTFNEWTVVNTHECMMNIWSLEHRKNKVKQATTPSLRWSALYKWGKTHLMPISI